ncbi:hypothetical protein [Algibacter sp. L4_22]|uniref:hypothetical protein n=1 Tax=Algibacter sp. L4_22 TaxID=2942477 RepID=UPI00201B6A5C|nr:hypothetical protein [Algibacter sp. L4_22]MCL5127479.1 hypothetical protein [Algibacter sp. L4_22]
MKFKILIVLSILLLFSACKKVQDTEVETQTEETTSQDLSEKNIAKLKYIEYALDAKTQKAIQDWQEYFQLETVINNVKKADLTFFYDNDKNIKTLLRDLKKDIPKEVNSPATLARISALETHLYKLKSLSNLDSTSKKELLLTIKDFLKSFSNLNFQMNQKIEADNINIIKP